MAGRGAAGDDGRGRFNPLRRSGGRATPGRGHEARPGDGGPFQSPPPKRGACDTEASTGGLSPSGKLLFQSPPPKRGACDCTAYPLTKELLLSGFNPLRRSGGRATSPSSPSSPRPWPRLVSIPSAEAGGVRRGSGDDPARKQLRAVSIPSAEAGGVRQYVLPRAFLTAEVSIPSAEAGGVRPTSSTTRPS